MCISSDLSFQLEEVTRCILLCSCDSPGSNSKFRKEILKSAVSIESVAHKNWFRWYKWRQVQDKWISVHQAPHLCTEGMKPVEFWFHWIRLLLLLLLLLEGKKKQTGFRGLLFLTEKLLCSEILIAWVLCFYWRLSGSSDRTYGVLYKHSFRLFIALKMAISVMRNDDLAPFWVIKNLFLRAKSSWSYSFGWLWS